MLDMFKCKLSKYLCKMYNYNFKYCLDTIYKPVAGFLYILVTLVIMSLVNCCVVIEFV